MSTKKIASPRSRSTPSSRFQLRPIAMFAEDAIRFSNDEEVTAYFEEWAEEEEATLWLEPPARQARWEMRRNSGRGSRGGGRGRPGFCFLGRGLNGVGGKGESDVRGRDGIGAGGPENFGLRNDVARRRDLGLQQFAAGLFFGGL